MMNEKNLREIASAFLQEIGEDPKRPGLIETPKRMAKMWMEVFRGYDPKNNFPDVKVFANNDDGIVYDQILIDQGKFSSFCEHHCALFQGKYYFGYIPDKTIVGLSKIARVIDFFSAKMQIQERIGNEVLDFFQEKLQPKGMILVLRANHSCKSIRGVKKEGTMTTSIVRGVFANDPSAKSEFFKLINI